MTKLQSTYNNIFYIPTREEFHRTFGGVITSADFDTGKPTPCNIDRISRTIKKGE